MTGKPIIFSAPMIRALLDERKTQTRRIMKPQPTCPAVFKGILTDEDIALFNPMSGALIRDCEQIRLPYAPGDRLWVREAHTITTDGKNAVYRVDATDTHGWRWSTITPGDPQRELKWRPSIHMPRWASRLTLTVTDVRVQRLTDISNEDARAEGAPSWWRGLPDDQRAPTTTAVGMFRDLWNSIHGPDAWAANPWVVALTFDVHRGNIDRVQA